MEGRRALVVAGLSLATTSLLGMACSSKGATIRETPAPVSTDTVATQLVERAHADLGYKLSVPSTWQESTRTVEEGRAAVLNFDPATGTVAVPRRAVDVILEVAKIADVRQGVEDVFAKRFKQYQKIRIVDGLTVGGRPAFRHEFLAEGLRYDQYWIERTGGSFRVTFWAPIEEFPGAGAINDQIIATFLEA
jgi:hypothetical protein